MAPFRRSGRSGRGQRDVILRMPPPPYILAEPSGNLFRRQQFQLDGQMDWEMNTRNFSTYRSSEEDKLRRPGYSDTRRGLLALSWKMLDGQLNNSKDKRHNNNKGNRCKKKKKIKIRDLFLWLGVLSSRSRSAILDGAAEWDRGRDRSRMGPPPRERHLSSDVTMVCLFVCGWGWIMSRRTKQDKASAKGQRQNLCFIYGLCSVWKVERSKRKRRRKSRRKPSTRRRREIE